MTETTARMSTKALGERLLALHEECGRQDWTTVDCPIAAAIIEELLRRGGALAREALEASRVALPC